MWSESRSSSRNFFWICFLLLLFADRDFISRIIILTFFSSSEIIFRETTCTTHYLYEFVRSGHQYDRKLITDDTLQTIQAIRITHIESEFVSDSTELSFSSDWAIDKSALRKILKSFYLIIIRYRETRQYRVFNSRKISADSSDDSESNLTSLSEESITSKSSRTSSEKDSKMISKASKINKIIKHSIKSVSYKLSIREDDQNHMSDRLRSESVEKISRMKFTSRQLEFMNNVIKRVIRKVTNQTTALRTNSTRSSDSSRPAEIEARWNSSDIEFFDFNFESQTTVTDVVVKHVEKDTYYRDVHVFVERIKKMTIVLNIDKVRQNLFTCLRDTALLWHTAELKENARLLFIYEKDVNHWIKKLTTRFKELVSMTTTSLLRERYIMKNVRRSREFKKYAQKIIRAVKSAEMKFIFNQLNIIYNDIDVKLRRDFRRFSNITFIDIFLQNMNECKNIWWDLARRQIDLKTVYFNRQDQFQNSSFSRFSEFQKQWSYNQNSFQLESWKYQYSQTSSAQAASSNKTSAILSVLQKLLIIDFSRSNFRSSLSSSRENQEALIHNNQEYQSQEYQNNQRYRDNQDWNQNYQKNQFERQQQERNQWQNNKSQDWNQRAYHTHVDEYDERNAQWNENDYYEDRSYDEILDVSDLLELEDDRMKSDENASATHFVSFMNSIFICRICVEEFYFNNKLHRHIRKNHNAIEYINNVEKIKSKKLSILHSTNKVTEKHEGFVFKSHQYVKIKDFLSDDDVSKKLCVDIDISMSLTNRKFVKRQRLDIIIHQTKFKVIVRGIDAQVHDNFEYVILNFYVSDKFKKQNMTAHFQIEMHLIDDLKTNVLIDMNIMISEEMIVDCEKRKLTIEKCDEFEINVLVARKSHVVDRAVRAITKTIVQSEVIMTISVRIRNQTLSKDQDYSFFSKSQRQLDLESDFFRHITNVKVVDVQIRNITTISFIISKNFKIEILQDYREQNAYKASTSDSHLTIASAQHFNVRKTFMKYQKQRKWVETLTHLIEMNIANSNTNLRKLFKSFNESIQIMKSMLSSDVIVYEDESIKNRLFVLVKTYSDIFKTKSGTIDVSSKRWMKIKTILEQLSDSARVFKIESKNRDFIDKEFDSLHKVEKMKWTTSFTSYVFSVFVIWITIRLSEKESTRKKRVIVDIRDLNKISEFDVYSMSLQQDLLGAVHECSYVSLMNCVSFFHQWLIALENRHKLTMITHRDSEQWNVTVMKFKNSSIYVQREMNNALRNLSFAKTYIDDVLMFNKILKKHLRHLNLIFKLFRKMNITLKSKKIYLTYSSIVLLRQKIDSLELITSTDKLKAIVKFLFSRSLKNLEYYLDLIEYLRDYISFYAQKLKSLQQRKTLLLKNELATKLSRKNHNRRTLLKNLIDEKIKAYNQLKTDFNRLSWLTHFNKCRQLFVDVNAFDKSIDVMIYHLKLKITMKIKNALIKRQIDFILFLSKILFEAEKRY